MCFSGIWAHWWDSPWIFSSVGWMLPVLSAFPPLTCSAEPRSLSPVCLCRDGAELDAALQVCSCQCWVEGKNHLPPPPGTTPPNAAQDIWVPQGVHCWPMFTLMSSRTPRSGLWCWCHCSVFLVLLGLSQLTCQASHCPVLNCVRVLPARLCCLSGSPGLISPPSGTSASPQVVASANLLRSHLAPLCRSLMMVLLNGLNPQLIPELHC